MSPDPPDRTSPDDRARLIAWGDELRRVHQRLRHALEVTRDSLAQGLPTEPLGRDLLLLCHGFCAALDGHHRGEDRDLFPAIARQHPALVPTLRALQQDHSMIAHLIGQLDAAARAGGSAVQLENHLDGIAALMENHFRYEERQLLSVLDALALRGDPVTILGPLAGG